jgi:hypothetical protein
MGLQTFLRSGKLIASDGQSEWLSIELPFEWNVLCYLDRVADIAFGIVKRRACGY